MEEKNENKITENKAAKLLKVASPTIRKWRLSGFIDDEIYKEKQYMRITRVTYDKEELIKWAKEHIDFEPKEDEK